MAVNTLQEWLNRNAYRAFPFADNFNPECTGGPSFPNSLVLDARFCLLGGYAENTRITLTMARVFNDGRVTLTLNIGGSTYVVTSADSVISYTDARNYVSLRIRVGNPEEVAGLTGGASSVDFRPITPIPFLRSRILSIPSGIGVDTLTCGQETGTEDIEITDGHNTTLQITRGNLVLSVGRGRGKGPICPEKGEKGGDLIYFMNGEQMDSNGNFKILAGEGVSISSGEFNGIPAVFINATPKVMAYLGG